MLEHHQLEITESKSTINYISFVDADDYWYPTFLEEMFEKQIVFRHQSIFSSNRNRNFKSTFPAHYAIAKTGDFEILNYFTASTKETIICTSCAVLKKLF
jgi:hypothetical protein